MDEINFSYSPPLVICLFEDTRYTTTVSPLLLLQCIVYNFLNLIQKKKKKKERQAS